MNNTGTATSLCLSTDQSVPNCNYYKNTTGSFICASCNTNYNLTAQGTNQICVKETFLDSNCLTYSLNANNEYQCSVCSSTLYTLSSITNPVNQSSCLTSAQLIPNCTAYSTDATFGYSCNKCATGFTLKPISGVNKCLPDSFIDPQCQTYILNGSNYECNQCNSLYSVKDVLINQNVVKTCILTNSQVIKDCQIYEPIIGGYQCYQCSSSENIARYGFVLNGVVAYRCLNSLT